MNLKQTLREFPVGSHVGLAFGLLLACGGALLLWISTPSPHGYIELIFAVPAIYLGLLFISVSLLCAYNHINWPLRVLAAILLIVVLYPLAETALFLFG